MAQQNNWQQTKKPRQPVRDGLVRQDKAINDLTQADIDERNQRISEILARVQKRIQKKESSL